MYVVRRYAIPCADLMSLERELARCHLDDVRFKQRGDDVSGDHVRFSQKPSLAHRPFEHAALYPILNDQVAGMGRFFSELVFVDKHAIAVQTDHSAVHSREP